MSSEPLQIGRSICSDAIAARQLEWLATNGIGGFSSSTIIGLHTRRYHGLLTAATKPPLGRMLLLSKLEETLLVDMCAFELSANQYPGEIHPGGFRYLTTFSLEPYPCWTYVVGTIQIKKSLFMVYGENTVVVEYELLAPDTPTERYELQLRPLIAFRDYHATTHANSALNPQFQTHGSLITLQPYSSLPPLFLAHNAGSVEPEGNWYYSFQYFIEQERGLDFTEDLFNPLLLTFRAAGPARFAVIASTEPHSIEELDALRAAELARHREISSRSLSAHPLTRRLVSAADQFIVRRDDLMSVVAGYHWFGDWGRDTMIALPGLTLVTGQFAIARDVLRSFGAFIDQGMLPNRFPDSGEQPEYNTVDATLWFFEAIRALVQYTGDPGWVQEHLYAKLKDIIEWHLRGTRFGIKADEDGLLCAGEPGVQLTWMDAKVGDWVVTPRSGKPVEIQALWYNALKIAEDFALAFGDIEFGKRVNSLSESTRRSFHSQFWNTDTGCLYDVIDGKQKDGSIRPNQIFAASLHHSMLSNTQAQNILAVVEQHLLTPYGLRTLSPSDPRYCPHYEGDVRARDGAYHQGTVWPWLAGPYISALLRADNRSTSALGKSSAWLETFSAHLDVAGLGQVSEIMDGDLPHTPRGCIAQAWSVAELLRVAAEVFAEHQPAIAWYPRQPEI